MDQSYQVGGSGHESKEDGSRKVLLGRSLLLSCSSILEGVQLGLKQDVLILVCRKLALEGSHLGHDLLDGWDVWISHCWSRSFGASS